MSGSHRRETVMNNDPALQLISPVDFGGMTCVFITKDGQSIALASQLDHLGLEQTETYDEVVDYGWTSKPASLP